MITRRRYASFVFGFGESGGFATRFAGQKALYRD
jgi:hypothetical protein